MIIGALDPISVTDKLRLGLKITSGKLKILKFVWKHVSVDWFYISEISPNSLASLSLSWRFSHVPFTELTLGFSLSSATNRIHIQLWDSKTRNQLNGIRWYSDRTPFKFIPSCENCILRSSEAGRPKILNTECYSVFSFCVDRRPKTEHRT